MPSSSGNTFLWLTPKPLSSRRRVGFALFGINHLYRCSMSSDLLPNRTADQILKRPPRIRVQCEPTLFVQ